MEDDCFLLDAFTAPVAAQRWPCSSFLPSPHVAPRTGAHRPGQKGSRRRSWVLFIHKDGGLSIHTIHILSIVAIVSLVFSSWSKMLKYYIRSYEIRQQISSENVLLASPPAQSVCAAVNKSFFSKPKSLRILDAWQQARVVCFYVYAVKMCVCVCIWRMSTWLYMNIWSHIISYTTISFYSILYHIVFYSFPAIE